MASFIFNSMVEDLVSGKFNFDADPFKVILVSSSPDKYKHSRRTQIVNEVVGEGYKPGGQVVAVVVNDMDNQTDILLGEAVWPVATIKARGAIYMKVNGGNLVAYIDFGKDINSVNGTFLLTASTLRIQN